MKPAALRQHARRFRESRRGRRTLLGLALLALVSLIDAFWFEPRVLLLRREVAIPVMSSSGAPLRVAHLSDLHVASETPLLRRLLAQVAAARPDFVVVSGDLIRDTPDQGPLARHMAALASFLAELRRIAPVWGVQGHSEHQGLVIAKSADAGLQWLSNEGVRVGPDIGSAGGVLLLGLNQQVGEDALLEPWPNPFRSLRSEWGWTYGAERGRPYRNAYVHFDPLPVPAANAGSAGSALLADTGGPLAWSGYELVCDLLIDNVDGTAGVTLHSRFPVGEDRMIRLIRDRPEEGQPTGFFLTAQGTYLRGKLETGIEMKPGRWMRVRVRTEVGPGRLRVLARAWPAGEREPRAWQAWGEDRSPHRLTAGTVGLWTAGFGVALYRDLKVVANDGRVLLERSLAGPGEPAGFRPGARGTRIAMALARSPWVPPGTPRIVLAHTPEPALEAARRGFDLVLVGHTHGGQVRLPFLGALTTRSRLGLHYDQGLFALTSTNPRGWTWLYIQPGVGTSLLPIRFWCPPSWSLVELGADSGARPYPPPR